MLFRAVKHHEQFIRTGTIYKRFLLMECDVRFTIVFPSHHVCSVWRTTIENYRTDEFYVDYSYSLFTIQTASRDINAIIFDCLMRLNQIIIIYLRTSNKSPKRWLRLILITWIITLKTLLTYTLVSILIWMNIQSMLVTISMGKFHLSHLTNSLGKIKLIVARNKKWINITAKKNRMTLCHQELDIFSRGGIHQQ